MCHLKNQAVIEFTSLTQDVGVGVAGNIQICLLICGSFLYQPMLQQLESRAFLNVYLLILVYVFHYKYY
jgi:hypothetical protein